MFVYLKIKTKLIMRTFILIFALALLGTSCQFDTCGIDKEHFLGNFKQFIKTIEKEDLEYSSSEWEKHDEKFKKFVKECYPEYKDKLTSEEKSEYYSYSTKYYVLKYGRGFEKFMDEHGEELAEQVSQGIEDFIEISADNVEEFINQLEESINEEKIEEFFEQLEEAIDEEKINEAFEKIGDFFSRIKINIELEEDKK